MIAIIEAHPIRHHAALYRMVQQVHGIPVTAIYGSDVSTDAALGTSFPWDTELLSGYTSVFLSSVAQDDAASADESATRGLIDVLRDLAPSAVLTVGDSPRFHRAAWLAALRIGCPILLRGETNDAAADRSWLKQIGRDTALRAAYSTCSRLLFVGVRSRQHFERLGVTSERLVFSPCSVDASIFQASEGDRAEYRRAVRAELGVSDDQIVVLFSGKLSRRKGVDLLIEAAHRLSADTRSRLVFAFLGDGTLRSDLERQIAESPDICVRFLGSRKPRQLSPYYHASDLLVLPSRHSESWGLVVNEALHHGVPCVVSDTVGCGPDLIEHGRTGHVFSTGSAYALAGALQSALGLIGRDDVRHACRAKAAGYSTKRAAAGIAEAYADVAGAGKAAEMPRGPECARSSINS